MSAPAQITEILFNVERPSTGEILYFVGPNDVFLDAARVIKSPIIFFEHAFAGHMFKVPGYGNPLIGVGEILANITDPKELKRLLKLFNALNDDANKMRVLEGFPTAPLRFVRGGAV